MQWKHSCIRYSIFESLKSVPMVSRERKRSTVRKMPFEKKEMSFVPARVLLYDYEWYTYEYKTHPSRLRL